MTRFIGCFVALMLLGAADVHAQGYIDGLMDRATESAKRKAQERVNQNIEQSIDKAIRKTEDTVKCVATDQECLRRAKEEHTSTFPSSAMSRYRDQPVPRMTHEGCPRWLNGPVCLGTGGPRPCLGAVASQYLRELSGSSARSNVASHDPPFGVIVRLLS